MTDKTMTFNPYVMKLRHMKAMETGFGVKFTRLIASFESRNGFDIAELSAEELMALVYMIRVVTGEDPSVEEIGEMTWDDLNDVVSNMATEDAGQVDPPQGG